MGLFGTALRLAIVAAWLSVTGVFVVHRLGLGSEPPADPAGLLAGRLDRTLVYELRWRPAATAPWELSGTTKVGARHEDIGIRTSTDVLITNQRVIPGARYLRHLLGGLAGNAGRDVRLRFDQILDSHLRLQAVDVDGSVFGIAFSATGPVDHNGLHLDWKAGGQSGSSTFAEVRPEVVTGGDFAVGLPAGLEPGRRFSSRFNSLEPGQLRLATKVAVYIVGARERTQTAAGEADLLRVEMRVEDRPLANLWCDAEGTVHHQELADQGLRLDLVRIDDAFGHELWPHPAPDAAVPP